VSSQWYLSNTGQRGAPGYDLNLLPIWGRYSGKGLIIAVNDDGMDLEHPDLAANLLVDLAYDGVRETLGQGFQDPNDPDINAHGTVVGSIIGMVANNGLGGTGIAWGAKIVPALNGAAPGQTAKVFLSNLAANAAVSVNSWGDDQAFAENFGASGTESNREWGAALTRLVTEGRGGLGTVIAVSGGNERDKGADIGLSNFTGNKFTIAVGAITHDGKPTDYSSPGASLLVTAPGGVASEESTAIDRGFGIASADVSGPLGYNKTEGEAGNYAFQNQGTSYSQPMVAAIAALMLEANPKLGFRDVSSILALTARKTDADNASWVQQQGTEWNLGGMHFSRDFGYGLVDAAAAVRLAESWAGGANTMSNWASVEGVSATPSGAIPDNTPNNFIFEATATVSQALTIERLEVDIGLTAALPNQLGAILISPSGTTHTLFDRPLTKALEGEEKVPTGPENAWPGVFTMGLTAFMGESSAGTWTLRVVDMVTGEAASFNSFTVRAWGKDLGPNNQYVFTDEYSGAKALSDPGGVDTLNAAAVSGAVTLSLTVGGNNMLPNGSFTLAAGTVIENAFGGAGNDNITGNTLNNLLRGNAGNDRIDGGAGIDTAVYGAPSVQATVQRSAEGLRVSSPQDGNDVLAQVERLQFADRALALDTQPDGHAGQTAQILRALVGADPNLSHRADRILSQGWKPTLRGTGCG
jgi:subtilisin-like proprotein convertase family protein